MSGLHKKKVPGIAAREWGSGRTALSFICPGAKLGIFPESCKLLINFICLIIKVAEKCITFTLMIF